MRCSSDIDIAGILEDSQVVEKAIGHGDEELLELLDKICILEHKSELMQHARFYRAAQTGDIGVIEKLLREGVSPDLRTSFGQTPLMNAVREGESAVIKALLETGAVNVNSGNDKGKTPLHYAVTLRLYFRV
jgi:ankyrin repeat protein